MRDSKNKEKIKETLVLLNVGESTVLFRSSLGMYKGCVYYRVRTGCPGMVKASLMIEKG